MRKFFILLTSTYILVCCNKSSDDPKYGYFPNSVGDQWNYLVIDSAANMIYHMNVTVVKTVKLPDGHTANAWAYGAPVNDTNYVYQQADTVFFLDPSKQNVLDKYVIPFRINNHWTIQSPEYDSLIVVNNDSLTVYGKDYTNVFELWSEITGPNAILQRHEWIAPETGLLLRETTGHVFEPYRVSWTLTDFSLK